MTLEELASTLPNGFHDAELKAMHVNYARRELMLELDIWLGDMDEREAPREAYRSAVVVIERFHFMTVEPPDPRYAFGKAGSLRLDFEDGPTKSTIPAVARLEAGVFTTSIFVDDWNSRIHVAGENAKLAWTGEQIDRSVQEKS